MNTRKIIFVLLRQVTLISLLGSIFGFVSPVKGQMDNLALNELPVINEFVLNHIGENTNEYIEVFGAASTDYSALRILGLEGDASGNPGVIKQIIQVGTTNPQGFWSSGSMTNIFENGSLTLLLVESFSGIPGMDLDANDDGVLDITPWSQIVDHVALSTGESGAVLYSSVVLSPTFDRFNAPPWGASRIPDGNNTGSVIDWMRNDFDLAGIPTFSGSPIAGEAYNTPAKPNLAVPVINEFVINHLGADNHEYIEIFGGPSADYSSMVLLNIEGDAGSAGRIDAFYNLGTTNTEGYWLAEFIPEILENGTVTFLLVTGFSSSLGIDLDSNDDGILDLKPWTAIVDQIGVHDGGVNDHVYSSVILNANYDGIAAVPWGASRIPNGWNSNSAGDWVRNDFDLAGIPGFIGTPTAGEAFNTPGSRNISVPVINEFVFDHAGVNTHEFIEVKGGALTDYQDFSLIVLEGDSPDVGIVDAVWDLAETNAGGYWATPLLTDALENGTMTIMLVKDFSGSLGQDLDSNNDGVLDSSPWAVKLDDVAINDGGVNDRTYSSTVLQAGYDGFLTLPGGASRIPDGSDTNSISDWMRNDFDLAGLSGIPGSPVVGEALNTPGARNLPFGQYGLHIHDIQGVGHFSPYANDWVVDVPGIVTMVMPGGFYLQTTDDSADALNSTSEGIYVYLGNTPAVAPGDSILVTALVEEYYQDGDTSGNLSVTRLINPDITVLSSGNSLPANTWVGAAGRMPPTEVIDNDSSGDVNFSQFDEADDGIDFYESLEGMLVGVQQALVVGPTNRFGEITVVPDAGIWAAPQSSRSGLLSQPGDNNPERIIIDNRLHLPAPGVDLGSEFLDDIVGVLDYDHGNFKLINSNVLPSTTGSIIKELSSLSRTENQLTIASFNLSGMDPISADGDDDSLRIASLASQIVANLDAPDILVVVDVLDNSGIQNDGVVSANLSYQALTDAISLAGGPLYSYVDIAPVDNADGGDLGGNSRVGFLYRTDRGLSFVSRSGGDAVTPATVSIGATGVELSASPGRIDPLNSAWMDSQKPLVGEFLFNNRKLFVVANHFVSKESDSPLFGRVQPPVFHSETQRLAQAEVINGFVEDLLTLDANAFVVVAGDFNDAVSSSSLAALQDSGLVNLYENLPVNEHYNYILDGNSQAIGHILVSPALLSAGADMDVIHLNAEFDYLERASDHDPLIARLTMAPIQVSFSEASYQVNEGDGSISITVSLSSMVALPVTINFSTASNTATAGDDFSEVSGQLEFTYGETSKNIIIPIIDDDIWEWLETFTIELTTPQNALLGSNYLTAITIHDNEETFFLHMPFIIND